MKSIFNIFQTLKDEPIPGSSSFNIASIPTVKTHKIGISELGLPMFFIKCDDLNSIKTLDYNLEYISVQYKKKCLLFSNNKEISKGFFTIISLKTDSIDLQKYFLEIVFLVVKNLPSNPKLTILKAEVEKLISLFTKFSKPAQKTVQGLWAELLVIEQASNSDYLIQSWHNSTIDKFDFNDGRDKIEVKSTSKSRRVHNFSIEQLNPNINSNLIIASVFAVETGLGKNIFNLVELIEQKLKDIKLVNRMNEIIAQTLGKEFEKAFEMYFDYQLAIDSLAYYECAVIPKISTTFIPLELSNIRFDCDLTNIKAIKTFRTKSTLHKSLI